MSCYSCWQSRNADTLSVRGRGELQYHVSRVARQLVHNLPHSPLVNSHESPNVLGIVFFGDKQLCHAGWCFLVTNSCVMQMMMQNALHIYQLTCRPTSTQSSSVLWKNLVAFRALNKLFFFRFLGWR